MYIQFLSNHTLNLRSVFLPVPLKFIPSPIIQQHPVHCLFMKRIVSQKHWFHSIFPKCSFQFIPIAKIMWSMSFFFLSLSYGPQMHRIDYIIILGSRYTITIFIQEHNFLEKSKKQINVTYRINKLKMNSHLVMLINAEIQLTGCQLHLNKSV